MRNTLLLACLVLAMGCGKQEERETSTKGKLFVNISESLAPVMIDEVQAFLTLYEPNGAHIDYRIVSAEIAAARFVQDTSRIAFLPRPLTPTEKEQAKKITGTLNELIVAYDGIVAVVNPKNAIEELSTSDIQKILAGTVNVWEQLGKKKTRGAISIVLHDSSDVAAYLSKRFWREGKVKLNRTVSDAETFRAVAKDPSAIGFAALDWIDSAGESVKVLNLGRTSEDTDTTFAPPKEAMGKFFSPHPANIYLNYYPLKRAIYMYTYGKVDLAAGFGTHVATAEGQKLFLKHNLLPATQKIRLRSSLPE
jgi:phosphate transport system substrate-binding protein